MERRGPRGDAMPQLTRGQIKAIFRNLEYLAPVDGAALEQALARLDAGQRAFVERWRQIIARSDDEVARLFVQRAPQAFALMDSDGVEAWLLTALEQFDRRGLGWAVAVLDGVERYARERAEQARRLPLSEIRSRLSRLVMGLGGRELAIEAGETPYTDSETIYLPAQLQAGDRQRAFALYKAMAVHHWAQAFYGTWRLDVLERLPAVCTDPQALARFAALERLRLDARIDRELPGLGRELRRLGGIPELSGRWREAAAALAAPAADGHTSLAWVGGLAATEPPAPAAYHGAFNPRQVRSKLEARLGREREAVRLRLGSLQPAPPEPDDVAAMQLENRARRRRKPTEGFTLSQHRATGGAVVFQLQAAEQPVAIPDELRELLQSIQQDLGEVPPDYLEGIGRRLYDARHDTGPGQSSVAEDAGDGGQVWRYPEWDYTRQRFRPDYCLLREQVVVPGDPDFVAQTRRRYHDLLKSIRRSFEALAGAPRLERRQPEGDDIDLDALVEARAEIRHGAEPSAGVYTRLRDNARSIAVMVMVDMSGSTKGWVIDAEREALVLLSEALETIGDRYAIYGFSGRTHQRVEVYHIKRFDERYGSVVQARISGIRPRAYTRLGAPIRHLGALLARQPARHKLLITLSDGKPEDYGSYSGPYGIEDTRHALLELRRAGIHPFCITIDREGGDYLPHMYGPANFTVIDSVPKLPLKVADIYRRLTS